MITVVTVTVMMLAMMTTMTVVVVLVTTVIVTVMMVMLLLVNTVKGIILIGPQCDAWIHFRSAFFPPPWAPGAMQAPA